MSILTKYRPTDLNEVRGHEKIVSALRSIIKDDIIPSFLFTGQSGLGKTTLGRVVAHEYDISDVNLIEVDGATFSSVESMRELTDLASYKPLGGSKRAIIVDECHRLSKQAFDSILKSVEESSNTIWILCSSEPEKLPKAIITRCAHFQLKPLKPDMIKQILGEVAEAEQYNTSSTILTYIAIKAKGIPRLALNFLAVASKAEDLTSAKELISSVDGDETPAILDLCRVLKSGGPWSEVVRILKSAQDEPEGFRMGVLRYFTTFVLNAKSVEESHRGLKILFAFSQPFLSSEKQAPVLIASARVLFPD